MVNTLARAIFPLILHISLFLRESLRRLIVAPLSLKLGSTNSKGSPLDESLLRIRFLFISY